MLNAILMKFQVVLLEYDIDVILSVTLSCGLLRPCWSNGVQCAGR